MISGLIATAVFAYEGANFALQVVSSEAAPQNQSYYIFEGEAGATLESTIRVANAGTAAGTVQLYAVDTATGQIGGTVFRMHDDPRQTAGSWIALASSEVTLAAGESQNVPFSVTIPADARAGHHVGGIVAEVVEVKEVANANADADSASFRVNLQSRSAMAVQVNLAGAVVEQIDVIGITAGGQQGHQTLLIGMRNSGNVMVKPAGGLVVSDAQGQQVQDLHFTMDTFLPETAIDYPVFVENEALAAGEYVADLTLQYGEGQESSHQLRFTVTEAQVTQVFGSRDALSAPAAGDAAEQAKSWRGVAVGGLIAFNVALALVLAGLVYVYYRRRKPAS